jgi:hypothetical protein
VRGGTIPYLRYGVREGTIPYLEYGVKKGTFGFGNNTCNSYTMKQNTPFSIRIPAFHGRKLPEVGVIVGYWVVDFW